MSDQPTVPGLATVDSTVVFEANLGYDPAAGIALAVLARTVRDLVVATSDEPTRRPGARYARALLTELGRPEVPVIAGHQLHGSDDRFLISDLAAVLDDCPRVDTETELARLCDNSARPVLWINAGPATNLATLATTHPHLLDALHVTMRTGWIDHAPLNHRPVDDFRLDPTAAGLVLRALPTTPRLVLDSHNDLAGLTRASPLYTALTDPAAPRWAQLLAIHIDRWLHLGHHAIPLDIPATVAAALNLPHTSYADTRVRIDPNAHLHTDPDGHLVQVSDTIDHPAITAWITHTLDLT
ncbi:hypothetical protein ACWEKT_32055 [Nocardia takedensis]